MLSKLDGINHDGLKLALITMQNSAEYRFYGYYALYFKFIEKKNLPAAAGVSIVNRKFCFYYNPDLIDEMVKKFGDNWLKFLVVHEVSHILLNHVGRTGDRDHQLSNISQDMLINDAIARDHGLSYEDFFYRSRDYPALKFKADEYEEKDIFEPLYAHIMMNVEKNGGKGQCQGDGKCPSCNGTGNADGQGTPGDGHCEQCPDCNGTGKGEFDPSAQDTSGFGGELVDYHSREEISEQDAELAQHTAKEIAETLKQRGFTPGDVLGKMFSYKKEKTVINVFKKVFASGTLRNPTYRKLNRRLPGVLKGTKKENRDVNVILDTSGSLFAELDQYIGQLVGKWNCYLVQIDTQVAWSGHIKSEKDWKKVAKKGGGGTTLMPAFKHLTEVDRSDIPTVLVTDGYCDNLDLSVIKAPVTIVLTKNSVVPGYNGNKMVKVIKSKVES